MEKNNTQNAQHTRSHVDRQLMTSNVYYVKIQLKTGIEWFIYKWQSTICIKETLHVVIENDFAAHSLLLFVHSLFHLGYIRFVCGTRVRTHTHTLRFCVCVDPK